MPDILELPQPYWPRKKTHAEAASGQSEASPSLIIFEVSAQESWALARTHLAAIHCPKHYELEFHWPGCMMMVFCIGASELLKEILAEKICVLVAVGPRRMGIHRAHEAEADSASSILPPPMAWSRWSKEFPQVARVDFIHVPDELPGGKSGTGADPASSTSP